MPADLALQPARANLRAALLVLLAFSAFSGTDALVKRLTESLPVPQVTAMITLVALLLVILAAAATGRAGALWPRHPGLAVLRAVLLAGDTLLIYYAFSALPLADAYVLAFLTPVLVALLAALFLHERLSRLAWLGVFAGFAGVIVALKPGETALTFGHAAALGSALLFALSLVLLRRAKAGESDLALVASVLVVLTLLSLATALAAGTFTAVTMGLSGLASLAGLLLFTGHMLLVRAFRLGDASVVAPFQYSQILWGCLYGALFFGAPVESHTLAGAAIIILSGWLVLK